MSTTRRLECCCCGNDAGRWQQHWNRDTGYGLCWTCAEWLTKVKHTPDDEMTDLYGKPHVNYGPPQVKP